MYSQSKGHSFKTIYFGLRPQNVIIVHQTAHLDKPIDKPH